MGRRVLVTIDLDSIASWAATYGVRLAARLEEAVALILVSSSLGCGGKAESAQLSLEGLSKDQRLWLDHVVRECQREGVSVEIYYSCGSFFEEVIRFIQSQSSIQFVVVGVPRDFGKGSDPLFSSALKRLHHVFGGEILLVWEKGRVTRLANSRLQNPEIGKET